MKNSSSKGTSLLADGTFMMFVTIAGAVIGFAVLLLLAFGGLSELYLVHVAKAGYGEALDAAFIQKLKVWQEIKPILALAIIVGGIVASIRAWAPREPSPNVFYVPGSKPQKITLEQAPPEEIETVIPQLDQVEPRQLPAPQERK